MEAVCKGDVGGGLPADADPSSGLAADATAGCGLCGHASDAAASDEAIGARDFDMDRHAAYFKAHVLSAPHHYKSLDTNRLTLLYFGVSGLDLLGRSAEVDRNRVVRYIYSLQSPLPDHGGFYGYPKLQCRGAELDKRTNQPHIANTYVALAMMIILGDDLAGVDRDAVAHSLRRWQLPDGSFCCVNGISNLDSESDTRFVYCAACICYILDLWHAIDVEGMFRFIMAARSYDGAFGMGPDTESHGGCTYCALAALAMMGRLGDLPGKERLVDWCIKRQHFGFQGRIEKAMDSCYSFWVGASLHILGVGSLLNSGSCASFLKECESAATGGFQKFPEVKAPDLLHSYFSVCGLSLCGLLQPLNPLLGISERAYRESSAAFRLAPGGQQWTPAVPPPARVAQSQASGAAHPLSAAMPISVDERGAPFRIAVLVCLVAVLLAYFAQSWG